MKGLISLVDLISRQKLHQINIVDEINNNDSKLSMLYNNIADRRILSDRDAISIIYGNTRSGGGLRKLKERLKNKLINSVFFIDQTNALYNDSMTAAKSCYKNYAAVRLLIGNRKRDVAIDLAKNTLKVSRKYEFTDLNYLISNVLAQHYLLHSLEKGRFNKYKKLRDKYFETLVSENEIIEMQGIFDISLSKSSMGLSEEELLRHSKEIVKINEKQKVIDSYRFNLFAFLYKINYNLESRNFASILKIVEEAFHFFETKGIPSVDVQVQLSSRSGIANFMLKNYEEARVEFNKLLDYSAKNSTNWFSAHNFMFGLDLFIFEYNEAYNTLCKVMASRKFESTHPLLVQQFKIKEAYIHFLVKLGKVDPAESSEKPLRKFRLNRFLNDVPTYSKDKRGVNISILIIQMILLVQNKKHGEIIDKLDALNMYSHRYLRSDNTFRSNCFIKMLAKLPDADYHPIRWERYVKKFRDRLDEHPFELSYHNLDLEVIPFETLYDLVVEMLYQQKGMDMPS